MEDEKLWGMPFEVAAGVIGLGGALLGAFVAAAATIWVARWQAKESLRMSRIEKLDGLVVDMYHQARAMSDAAGHGGNLMEPLRGVVQTGGLVMTRAKDSASWLSKQVEAGVDDLMTTMETLAGLSDGQSATTEPPLPSDLEAKSWALTGVLVKWLTNPERFARDRPTYAGTLEEVRDEDKAKPVTTPSPRTATGG